MSTKEMINENEEYANLNSVKQYMKEISRYPLLTDEEEKDIFARIANGDPVAAETLINSNLRLVVSVARHYATCSSMPLLDLIQEGNTLSNPPSCISRKFIAFANIKFFYCTNQTKISLLD